MDSHMANYGKCLVVCHYLHQTHLQEVGLMQSMVDYVRVKGFRQLVRPLDENQGPHSYMVTLYVTSPWLVCEVALRY